MKSTRIIALALAALTALSMVACGGKTDETSGATTTASTTAPTPKPKPASDEEKPATGTRVQDWLTSNLNGIVTDIKTEGFALWDDGAAANLFDGDILETKLGGGVEAAGASVTWKTALPTKLQKYVLVTGGDSETEKRTPQAWTLSGSNDGSTWTEIDKVVKGNITPANSTPYGYSVDKSKMETYTQYKITFDEKPEGGAIQFNELVLIGTASNSAENLVTEPANDEGIGNWGDGPAANLFDGDFTGTKLGGSFTEGATITWKTSAPVTLSSYVIFTGGDTSKYPGRNPASWVLYGSNDGETWNVISTVENAVFTNKLVAPEKPEEPAGTEAAPTSSATAAEGTAAEGTAPAGEDAPAEIVPTALNASPFLFGLDNGVAPTAYTQYKMVISAVAEGDAIQMNELVMLG